MRQKRKNLKISKAAMSASTAFLVLSTIVSAAGNAAQTNEFVISADKDFPDAGDSFNVFVDFLPDVTGAAGFTIDLHYDPEKVSPNFSDNNGGVISNSDFYIVANYIEEVGIVRLVGANMSGDNITKDSRLLEASFTVLDGAEGELDYWLDVDSLVFFDGKDYVYADFSAPDSDSPYSVSVYEEPVTTTTTTTTTTSVTTEPPITETEPPVTTTTSESTTTSAPAVVEIPDPEETTTTVTEASEPEAPTTQATTTVTEGKSTLFEHSAMSYDDSVGEEVIQYGFNISDYITDYSCTYDVHVKLNTTGYIKGGIGMMDNLGSWGYETFESDAGADEWVFTELDPNKCWDQVFVQIYYLQYGARMEISSIEFVPNAAEIPSLPEQQPDDEKQSDDSSQPDSDPGYTPTVPVEQETPDSSDDGAGEDETLEEDPHNPQIRPPHVASPEDKKEEQTEAPSTEPEGEAPESTPTTDEKKEPSVGATETPSEEVKPSEVEDKVSQITSEAEKNSTINPSNSNPDTGSKRSASPAMALLQAAAALEIIYSLFAIIYNKLGSRKMIHK